MASAVHDFEKTILRLNAEHKASTNVTAAAADPHLRLRGVVRNVVGAAMVQHDEQHASSFAVAITPFTRAASCVDPISPVARAHHDAGSATEV
jgi:hypothetical protein